VSISGDNSVSISGDNSVRILSPASGMALPHMVF
jgi:hypothetical protein